jgi:hypothetical protein
MSSSLNVSAIKSFVKNTLGCTCPDEVFNQIECKEEYNPGSNLPCCKRLLVGNRLLIYLWHIDSPDVMRANLVLMTESGKNERDDKGYNRFRLVLSTSCPEELDAAAKRLFDPLAINDEKLHLHIVNVGELPELTS